MELVKRALHKAFRIQNINGTEGFAHINVNFHVEHLHKVAWNAEKFRLFGQVPSFSVFELKPYDIECF